MKAGSSFSVAGAGNSMDFQRVAPGSWSNRISHREWMSISVTDECSFSGACVSKVLHRSCFHQRQMSHRSCEGSNIVHPAEATC